MKTVNGLISGHKLNVVLSDCCMPIPGDRIVAERVQNDIFIHRRSCPHISGRLNPPDPGIISVEWNWLHEKEYKAKFKILLNEINPDRILKQVSETENVKIQSVSFSNTANVPSGTVTIKFQSVDTLKKLGDSLLKLPEVNQIERI